MTIIWAIVILGALGIIFGLILAVAAKVFEVEVDPRLPEIQACLAGILLRTPVENIRVAGRATHGVIVMRFKEEGDRVISMALAEREEETPAPAEE